MSLTQVTGDTYAHTYTHTHTHTYTHTHTHTHHTHTHTHTHTHQLVHLRLRPMCVDAGVRVRMRRRMRVCQAKRVSAQMHARGLFAILSAFAGYSMGHHHPSTYVPTYVVKTTHLLWWAKKKSEISHCDRERGRRNGGGEGGGGLQRSQVCTRRGLREATKQDLSVELHTLLTADELHCL